MSCVVTEANRDLEVLEDNKVRWTRADYRRWGFHNLHRIARYGISLRAREIMTLTKRGELDLAALDSVRLLTSLPWFSAMIVTCGQDVLFERYASDFGPERPHSIQSISKTNLNLIVGRLVDQGILDLAKTVSHYIPEIGTGYARASLQQVLNMDVVNDYSEDFTDAEATYYRHEEAMGWRLPREPAAEETQHGFIVRIASADTTNHGGRVQYKDANSDVLGWVVERASGRSLRAFLADITDAAGLEGSFHITTDREGVPALDGGASLTARDLARYFSLFVRKGCGIHGEMVGSEEFIAKTLISGVPMTTPYEGRRYSNHLIVSGDTAAHGGWGGQCVLANLKTRKVAVFLSVIENQHATNTHYLGPVIRTLESLCS